MHQAWLHFLDLRMDLFMRKSLEQLHSRYIGGVLATMGDLRTEMLRTVKALLSRQSVLYGLRFYPQRGAELPEWRAGVLIGHRSVLRAYFGLQSSGDLHN